jgi:hypothetical protein
MRYGTLNTTNWLTEGPRAGVAGSTGTKAQKRRLFLSFRQKNRYQSYARTGPARQVRDREPDEGSNLCKILKRRLC